MARTLRGKDKKLQADEELNRRPPSSAKEIADACKAMQLISFPPSSIASEANDIWLVGSVVFFQVCLVTNLTVLLESLEDIQECKRHFVTAVTDCVSCSEGEHSDLHVLSGPDIHIYNGKILK